MQEEEEEERWRRCLHSASVFVCVVRDITLTGWLELAGATFNQRTTVGSEAAPVASQGSRHVAQRRQ